VVDGREDEKEEIGRKEVVAAEEIEIPVNLGYVRHMIEIGGDLPEVP
jgi:hypothetical protein